MCLARGGEILSLGTGEPSRPRGETSENIRFFDPPPTPKAEPQPNVWVKIGKSETKQREAGLELHRNLRSKFKRLPRQLLGDGWQPDFPFLRNEVTMNLRCAWLCLLLAIFLAAKPVVGGSHSCGSEHIRVPEALPSYQQYADPGWDGSAGGMRVRRRRLAQTAWQGIRVVPYYQLQGGQYTDEEDFVVSQLMPAAAAFLESALLVDRVVGNLKLARPCSSYWTSNGVCASLQSTPSCGTTAVPEYMLGDTQVCTSSPTTGCSVVSGGAGVPDADVVVFVTVQQTNYCGSSTLACTLSRHVESPRLCVHAVLPWPDAASCGYDQFDRPTHTYINFCPDTLTADTDLDYAVDVALHEMVHGLGFSSWRFAYFRDADGNPLTPRNGAGMPQLTSLDCGDGSSWRFAMPGSNIVESSTGDLGYASRYRVVSVRMGLTAVILLAGTHNGK